MVFLKKKSPKWSLLLEEEEEEEEEGKKKKKKKKKKSLSVSAPNAQLGICWVDKNP